MKIKNSHSSSKTVSIIALIIAITAGIGGTTYAYFSSQSTQETDKSSNTSPEGINYDEATTEQQDAGTEQKKQTIDTVEEESTGPLTILFTAATPMVIGDVARVRVQINAVTSSGECTLTLTKEDIVVVKKSEIQAGPSTSTCKGFDVALSELSSGQWQAEITVVSEGRTGKATQAFTV